jgi:hypothetical protein
VPYVLVHANHGDSPNGEYALYYRCAQWRERLGYPETDGAVAARASLGHSLSP